MLIWKQKALPAAHAALAELKGLASTIPNQSEPATFVAHVGAKYGSKLSEFEL